MIANNISGKIGLDLGVNPKSLARSADFDDRRLMAHAPAADFLHHRPAAQSLNRLLHRCFDITRPVGQTAGIAADAELELRYGNY